MLLTEEANTNIKEIINKAVNTKTENFGNARYVRNLFEKAIENQAVRLAVQPTISRNDLITITDKDVAEL